MSKVNSKLCAKHEERPVRITRSRARTLGGGVPPLPPSYSRPSSKNEAKNVHRATSSKRAVSSLENQTCVLAPPRKRRAVLTDVTNVTTKSRDTCVKESKFQVKMLTLSSNAYIKL